MIIPFIVTIFFLLAGVAALIIAAYGTFLLGFDPDVFFPLIFGLIATTLSIRSFRLLRGLQDKRKKDYAWYRKQYPEFAQAGGGTRCRECHSHRIHVRALLQQTRLREHLCGDCGTALFYSKED